LYPDQGQLSSYSWPLLQGENQIQLSSSYVALLLQVNSNNIVVLFFFVPKDGWKTTQRYETRVLVHG